MDAIVDWVIHHFQREFGLITGAPFMVLACFALRYLSPGWRSAVIFMKRAMKVTKARSVSKRCQDKTSCRPKFTNTKTSSAGPRLTAAKEIPANLRGSVANTRAELDMNQRIGWRHHTSTRHLTEEQAKKLIAGLEAIPADKREFFVVGAVTDPECQQYAIEIMAAFKSGGFLQGADRTHDDVVKHPGRYGSDFGSE